jgi:DNA-binding NarL/FixJ family response regulator
MKSKIQVILVDDHAVVRAGFRMLLSTSESIDVIAEADRGEQAIQLIRRQHPDVIVMDLSMPGLGGLETIRRICSRDEKMKILVFSVHNEQVYVTRALTAGARGYITKNSAPEILIKAIDKIVQGEIYIETGLTGKQNDHNIVSDNNTPNYKAIISAFSSREFDVFLLLAKGLTAYKIADELCLGYKTIANYSTQVKKKLQVSTLIELEHIALALDLMKR